MRDITCEKCINLKNGWCGKIIDSPDKFRKRDCQYYKTVTNADRIRNMTNEELAVMLMCPYENLSGECFSKCEESQASCIECTLEWLQKEVEE